MNYRLDDSPLMHLMDGILKISYGILFAQLIDREQTLLVETN